MRNPPQTKAAAYAKSLTGLERSPRRWVVTGVAGFIGSHVLETLLRAGQRVTGLDNLSTGREENLADVRSNLPASQWSQFSFIHGDVTNLATAKAACEHADYLVHLAALSSVRESLADPVGVNQNNVTGFLNVLVAGRDAGIRRIVYASGSCVYGDSNELPNVEDRTGRALVPAAVSMAVNELYAQVFSRAYGVETIGLRYFNVFGPRQPSDGADAPVVPRWIRAMITNQVAHINGDGATSRDFCYVADAVQATILAATTTSKLAISQMFNVASSQQTSLNQLFELIRRNLLPDYPHLKYPRLVYRDFRPGDVRHSRADISRARRILGYAPAYTLEEGLQQTVRWYRQQEATARPPGGHRLEPKEAALS